MDIDTNQVQIMPLIVGPLFDQAARPQYKYSEIDVLAFQFRTDPNAIRAVLPDCYQVGAPPTVSVVFGDYDGVDFMAGGGYRTATFQVAARFDGTMDHIEADHILVMLEDKTMPIISGRELIGVPKIYADISPVKTLPNGRLRCEASLWGHLLFGIEVEPLNKQNPVVRWVANRRENTAAWLCYKYIPSLDGPPDASYPTLVWTERNIEQLWLGTEGRLYLGDAGEDDISYAKRMVDALRSLPVLETITTVRMKGSSVLRMDLSRRLE